MRGFVFWRYFQSIMVYSITQTLSKETVCGQTLIKLLTLGVYVDINCFIALKFHRKLCRHICFRTLFPLTPLQQLGGKKWS